MAPTKNDGLSVGAKAVLSAVGTVVLLGFAGAGAVNAQSISTGVEAQAEVLAFAGPRSTEYVIVFETQAGVPVETVTLGSSGQAQVGDSITVLYDPEDPSIVAEKTGDYFVLPVVLAVGALVLGAWSLSLYLVWRSGRKR